MSAKMIKYNVVRNTIAAQGLLSDYRKKLAQYSAKSFDITVRRYRAEALKDFNDTLIRLQALRINSGIVLGE